jgi:aspartyl protease family protein
MTSPLLFFKAALATIIWLALLCPWHTLFAEEIQIVGLFKNKVIMNVDGRRTVLSVGEKTPDGVKVVEANSKNCVLLIDDKEQSFTMGTQVSVNFKKNSAPKVRITQDNQGMYRHDGKINGNAVKFLVDTGASVVALNINQAKSLGLELKNEDITEVKTASGQARAYRVLLRKVSIGGIILYDVPAVVVDGSSPHEILLGMSFLQHLTMSDNNKTLELTKKY